MELEYSVDEGTVPYF